MKESNWINSISQLNNTSSIKFSNELNIVIKSLIYFEPMLTQRTVWWRVDGITLTDIFRTCWAKDVWPTSNQLLTITLDRWAKWRWATFICQCWVNNTVNKIPTLAQLMTYTIWEVVKYSNDKIYQMNFSNISKSLFFGRIYT